jgi:hypothetical protein
MIVNPTLPKSRSVSIPMPQNDHSPQRDDPMNEGALNAPPLTVGRQWAEVGAQVISSSAAGSGYLRLDRTEDGG